MASAQPHQQIHSYTAHQPPSNHYDVRLPPIRELGVVYRDEQSSSAPQPQPDYSSPPSHPSRHDPQVWSRSSNGPGPAPPQHAAMHPLPVESVKPHYPNKPEPHYATPGLPLSAHAGPPAQVNGTRPGSGRGDPPLQPALKRARSNSNVGEAPGRSPHAAYPPHTAYSTHPAPPTSFHQPQQSPPSSHTPVHPPAPFPQPGAGYPSYVSPQHLAQRHYPPPPPATHVPPPPNPQYPPSAPAEHWQHQQPQQPQPQQQQQQQPQAPQATYQTPPAQQGPYNNFPRPAALVPENVEARSGAMVHDSKKAASRQQTIAEIVEHCNVLYQFANRYSNQPHVQPSPEELVDMTRRASLVVRLMEELRRLSLPEDQLPKEITGPNGTTEEHRPPKRPWEDAADENDPSSNTANRGEYAEDKKQSTAEQDMEIIRSKRATSAAGNAPGQPKSKYRKRSRATPPGKCHSCNIRETPEWRRGPDGARTLCNACGLHYAKLMRKRDKNGIGPDGKPTITIESLRASTASARGGDQNAEPPAQQPIPPPHQSNLIPPPYDQHPQGRTGPSPPHLASQYSSPHPPPKPGPPPPMHNSSHPHPQHSGPYQLMPVPSGHPQGGHHLMHPSSVHGEPGVNLPTPSWMTSPAASGAGRPAYGEHQTYMRTSHPPSHTRASPQ